MAEDLFSYLILLVAIIVGFIVIKKVASCLIRIIITLIILAAVAYLFL